MKMLRHKGTKRVFIYTDALAMHPEMEPFNVPDTSTPADSTPAPAPQRTGGLAAAIAATTPAAPKTEATAEESSAEAGESGGQGGASSAGQTTSVYDITDRDVLRTMLNDRGIKVAGNLGVKAMQEKLAKALAAAE